MDKKISTFADHLDLADLRLGEAIKHLEAAQAEAFKVAQNQGGLGGTLDENAAAAYRFAGLGLCAHLEALRAIRCKVAV
jgi:hypothetical protein